MSVYPSWDSKVYRLRKDGAMVADRLSANNSYAFGTYREAMSVVKRMFDKTRIMIFRRPVDSKEFRVW